MKRLARLWLICAAVGFTAAAALGWLASVTLDGAATNAPRAAAARDPEPVTPAPQRDAP